MKSTLLVAAQAIFAIFGLRQLVRNVLPELPRLRHPQLILDIWAPLAVAGPMLFLIGRMNSQATGPAWLALGGPLLCAILGVGLALIRAGAVGRNLPAWGFASNAPAIAACGAGLLILLLGAAHDLTMWMGQCAFAIGAVLLWINTPADADSPLRSESSELHDRRAGLGMTATVSCAIVQGHVMMALQGPLTFVSGIMAVVYAMFALSFVAMIAGPLACARVALWAAALGVFFGLGLLSLTRMIPQAFRVMELGYSEPVNRIASGFGMLAPESAGLIVVAALAFVMPRLNSRMSMVAGLVVVAAGMAAFIARMLAMAT